MQESERSANAVNDGAKTMELDVRGLEPPQPILAILKKVSDLPANMMLEVRIDSNPWQLYDLLQQRGFFYQAERALDGGYKGVVRARDVTSGH